MEVKLKYENLFEKYPSTKQRCEETYNEVASSYQESVDSAAYYLGECMYLDSIDKGNLYVAKLLGRNEYTHKPNEYNSYSIFAYNTDGTIHPIDTGDNMKIIISVFPKAKKDLQKVLGDALGGLVDTFND